MNLNQYQKAARKTAIYPREFAKVYPLLGLVGEVGEFSNKYKKVIRDGKEFSRKDATAEIGDILWYVANLAADFGLDLNDVAEENVKKLTDRQKRGVLGGSGDNR